VNKDVLKTIAMDLSLISEHDISEEYFYDSFSIGLFNKMKDQADKGYKMYNLNSNEVSKLKDSKYLLKENIKGHLTETKDITLRYKAHDLMSSSMEKLKNKNVNLTNIIEGTKEILTEIDYLNGEDIILKDNTCYIEDYKKQTEEMEKSTETRFYTFSSHPILKKHFRLQKGMFGSLISHTGGGKSVVSAMMAIDFAKNYRDQKVVFLTDENSEETIKEYMLSHYFNLSIADIQLRDEKIDEYIDSLNDADRKEYYDVFSRIITYEMVGLPTDKIKRLIKSIDNVGLLVVDSFEETNSLSSVYKEEVDRYNASAKIWEAMAKELHIIILVTAQLATNFYQTCITKLPKICNYSSKQLVKKNFFSIILHATFDKDGNKIDDAMKISKNRTGQEDITYAVKKKYSHMQLIPEDKEYDLERIKSKSVEKLDF